MGPIINQHNLWGHIARRTVNSYTRERDVAKVGKCCELYTGIPLFVKECCHACEPFKRPP